ncbi:MAG: NifB/NifX family molybdenum-iron cluster-binding protein [Deltaproteobacteria bacterium]|nr:NifB/NifX family molybdenum-iron cluster-binding protein [Deltaproteobacteria bacterium]
MKIAISAKGKTLSAEIDPRFGRAAFFILVNPETMHYAVVENKQNLHLPQGAGIQAAQIIVESGANILLTGNCGPKAFQVLKATGIKVAVGISGTLMDAVTQFKQDKINYAETPNVEGHWG